MKFIHLIRCNIPYVASDQMLRIMKLFIVIMTTFLMQVSASSFAQHITLKQNNISLKKVFSEIRKQTGYTVFYESDLIDKTQPINLDLSKVPLETALKEILDHQNLGYEIKNKAIVISVKAPSFLDKLVDAFTPPIDVYGVVLDENGSPLVGATVKVKGFQQSTTTDREGKFSLKGVDDKAVLVISFIGYSPKEVAAKASVSVSLEIQSAELQEVNVAYGKTTQQALTGSVTVVKGEDIQAMPNRSFDRSLQGLVPGLLVSNGSGQPGGGVSNFVLRGISTAADVTAGSTVRNPLIVIDGIPVSQDNAQLYTSIASRKPMVSNPLAQLNPSDIETLTVLKDAAAIALYGSRASSGVIVITTKRGKSGKTSFAIRSQTDIASRIDGKQKLLNGEQYKELLYEAYRNSNPITYATDQAIFDALTKPTGSTPARFLTRSDGSFYPATDWIGSLYSEQAITLANELSISGGTEKSNYYLNIEYTKQNGVLEKTGYDRKGMRFNFENRPANWLKLGLNSALSYNLQDYGAGLRSLGVASAALSPFNPIQLENGEKIFNYSSGSGPANIEFASPLAQAELNINRNTSFRGLSKVFAEVSFLDNFRFTSNLGVDFMLTEAKEKNDPRLYDEGIGFDKGVGRIEERDTRRANLITTNTLNFTKVINNNHTISALAGQEAQILSQKNLAIGVRKLSVPYYDQISSPGVEVFTNSGFSNKETLLSYFGQINYDYKNKYFLTSSVRRDGSSRFGEDKRYGTYWSSGLGWVMSNESFFKTSWIDYMKVRGSFGAAGNAAAINAQTRYDQLANALFLDGTAVFPTQVPGSPDVHWEKTFSWDLGFETRLLNNRVSITADLYKKYTSDLIYPVELPQVTGYYNVLQNIGDIENKGLELSLNTQIINGKSFSWSFSANWSTNQNKLVKANVPSVSATSSLLGNKEGENFNTFYLVRWAGVDPETGNAQYYDLDGNKTTTFSNDNKVLAGKPQPDAFGGITNRFDYRGFDMSIVFYYQYGNMLYIEDGLVNDGYSPYMNQSIRALDRWQKQGDIAANPKRVLNNSSGRRVSTRFLYDGDYLRLQNITLGYRMPKNLLRSIKITDARVFIQGNNLALWSKFPGDDVNNVDVNGGVGLQYPNQRSFSIGLNANF